MRKYQSTTLSSSRVQIHETTMHKISQTIYDLHSHLIKITKNTKNFRYLTEDEQELLKATESQNDYHNLLAGVLAVDSCVRGMIEKEEKIQKEITKIIQQFVKDFKILGQRLKNQEKDAKRYVDSQNIAIIDLFQHLIQTISRLLYVDQVQVQHCYQILQSSQSQIQSLISPRRFLISTLKEENRQLKKEVNQLESKSLKLQQKLIKCLQQYEQDLKTKKADCYEIKRISELEKENEFLKRYVEVDCVELIEKLENQVQFYKEKRMKDYAVFQEIRTKMEQLDFRQMEDHQKKQRNLKFTFSSDGDKFERSKSRTRNSSNLKRKHFVLYS